MPLSLKGFLEMLVLKPVLKCNEPCSVYEAKIGFAFTNTAIIELTAYMYTYSYEYMYASPALASFFM